MEVWIEEAFQLQQEFYDRLGDRHWDYIKSCERWALEFKVGFALFGEPTEEDELNNNGYSKENAKEIKSMCDLIYKVGNSREIYIAFLFVIGKGDVEFICPIFRVMTLNGTSVFLDHSGRVYKDWEDFKNNNKYPKSELCFPKDGVYQADKQDMVLVTFAQSPACSLSSKTLTVMDVATSVVSVAAIGVGIASIWIPIVGPIALATAVGTTGSGLYGIGRGSYQIHDRRIHKQSISLTDREARNCWLSVFGSIFGVGSGLTMKGMVALAARGKDIGKAGRIVIDMLNFGSLTVNGFGVANGLANLIEKKMNDKLTALDVLQFTSSVLFFTNAAMNTRTAKSIIEQVQSQNNSKFKFDFRARLSKAFDKLVRKTGRANFVTHKATIIKGITNVASKDDFFRMAVKSVGTTVEICMVFSNLGKKFINLSDGVKLDLNEDLIEQLAELFKKYFYSIWNGSCSSETISDVIIQSERFAEEKGCVTEDDFIDFVRFLMIYEMSCLKDMENRYQKEKNEVKRMMEDDFDESSFDRKWGIQDSKDRKGSFLKIINVRIEESNEDLKKKFDFYNQEVTALNQDGGLKFRTNYIALNEFYHSFVIDGRELSPIDFFEVIRQMANDDKHIFKREECFKGMCITYSDRDESMFVKVVEIEELKFLESVSVVHKSEL